MPLNRYQCIGNIGADAEVRTINDNQRAVISFRMAVTEKWKDAQGNPQERTTWVKCSIWRKPGQTGIAEYLKKGQQVYVEGKPTAQAYLDKDGKPQASLELTVDNVELLEGRRNDQGGGPSPHMQTPQHRAQTTPAATAPNVMDDDLPF